MKYHIAPIALIAGIVAPVAASDLPEEFSVAGSYMVRASGEAGLADLLEAIEALTPDPDSVEVFPLLPGSDIYNIVVPDVDTLVGDQIGAEISNLTDGETLIWSEEDYILGHSEDNEGQSGSLWVSGLDLTSADYANQYAFDLLEIDAAHLRSQGEGVSIAILDTQVDLSHPQIKGVMKTIDLVNYGSGSEGSEGELAGNGFDEDGDGHIDESLGHGTFVTALVQSVAPKAGVLSIAVLNDDGIGSAATLALGISIAVNEGAHIISLSLGSETESLAVSSVIEYAVASGVTVFAAVGNTGSWGCLFPARHPEVIAVGASDNTRELANISSYHYQMDMVAPGLSNLIMNNAEADRLVIGPTHDKEFVAGSGTSFSTAFAAGAGALVRAQLVDLEASQLDVGKVAERITKLLKLSPFRTEIPNDSGQTRPVVEVADATNRNDPVPGGADINGDGMANGQDLALILGRWGLELTSGELHREDLERDGVIDGQDLARLLGGWGSP